MPQRKKKPGYRSRIYICARVTMSMEWVVLLSKVGGKGLTDKRYLIRDAKSACKYLEMMCSQQRDQHMQIT